MNKMKRTLVAVFGVLFLLCAALIAVGCTRLTSDNEPPASGPRKSAYSISVDVNDASFGAYTITAANDGEAYTEGTPVTITVQPREGYEASLTVNGEAVELVNNAYTFMISSDTSILVNYSYCYTVSVCVSQGKADVNVSGPKNGVLYEEGEEIAVTVAPQEGYLVKSVMLNGAEQALAEEKNGTYSFKFKITGKSYVAVACVEACDVSLIYEDPADAEKGVVRLDGAIYVAPVTVGRGDTVQISVDPKDRNTVKAVYANGALVPLTDNAGSVKIMQDAEIKVVYDKYFKVTCVTDAHGELLPDKASVAGDGYYAGGSILTLTAVPSAGYVFCSAKMTAGEGDNVKTTDITDKFVHGKYSFTVGEDVRIEVAFTSSPKVVVFLNNRHYGKYELSGAEPDHAANSAATYPYGSELTLTATPNRGFTFGYLQINGTTVAATSAEEGGSYTYTFQVTENLNIYLCFLIKEQYRVTLNDSALSGYGVTATLEDGILGYDGEEISVGISKSSALPEGKAVFYTANGGPRQIVTGDGFTAVVDGEDLAIEVFVADLLRPRIVFSDGLDDAAYSAVFRAEGDGAEYIVTLRIPAHEGYLLEALTVTANGAEIAVREIDGEGYTFSLPYDESKGGMDVAVSARSIRLFSLTLPTDGNGKIETEGFEYIRNGKFYFAEGEVRFRIVPDDGYRVKSVRYISDADGSQSILEIDAAGPVAEQYMLAADTTVEIEYQQVYTLRLAFAAGSEGTATLEVTTAEDARLLPHTDGSYTLDKGGGYLLTVRGTEQYRIRSVLFNGTSVPVERTALEATYSFTATADATVTVETTASVVISWIAVGSADKAVITLKNGGAEVRNGETVGRGTVLTLEVAAEQGYGVSVTAEGAALTKDATRGAYAFTAAGLKIALTVAVAPILADMEFPESSKEELGATEKPSQGVWRSVDEASAEELTVAEHGMIVGGDAVTGITVNGAAQPGKAQYTLRTESGKIYTLSWFEETAGYILALAEGTQSGAALCAARSVRYYLNPALGERDLHSEFTDGDEEKLTGTFENGGEQLVIGKDADGRIALVLGGARAEYVIRVRSEGGRYFAVMESHAVPQVLSVSESGVSFGGKVYERADLSADYTVTVSMTGNSEGGAGFGYELKKKDGGAFGPEDRVGASDTLTLTVKVPQGYHVTLALTNCNYTETGTNLYTVGSFGGNAEIVITYVKDEETPAPEKRVEQFKYGTISESGVLNFRASIVGYSADELNTAALVSDGISIPLADFIAADGETVFGFDLSKAAVSGGAGDFALRLKIGDDVYELIASDVWSGTYEGLAYVFTLGGEVNGAVRLSVAVKPPKEPEKSLVFGAAGLETAGDIRLFLNITAAGYPAQTLTQDARLAVNGQEYAPQSDSSESKLYFVISDWEGSTDGVVYSLGLKIGDAVTVIATDAAFEAAEREWNGKLYSLGKDAENRILVTVKTAASGDEDGDPQNGGDRQTDQWTGNLAKGGSLTFGATVAAAAGEGDLALTLRAGDGELITFFLGRCTTPDGSELMYSDADGSMPLGDQDYSVLCGNAPPMITLAAGMKITVGFSLDMMGELIVVFNIDGTEYIVTVSYFGNLDLLSVTFEAQGATLTDASVS